MKEHKKVNLLHRPLGAKKKKDYRKLTTDLKSNLSPSSLGVVW
jgi:hypothetical protein